MCVLKNYVMYKPCPPVFTLRHYDDITQVLPLQLTQCCYLTRLLRALKQCLMGDLAPFRSPSWYYISVVPGSKSQSVDNSPFLESRPLTTCPYRWSNSSSRRHTVGADALMSRSSAPSVGLHEPGASVCKRITSCPDEALV